MESERPFVVVVSGPSSSGKTTLSVLLAEIFGKEESKDIYLPAAVLHQDSYFRPKEQCPETTFTSAPTLTEIAFMRSSMLNDQIKLYKVERTSPVLGADGHADSCVVESSRRAGLRSALRCPCTEAYVVTGPNTDCDDAISFESMISDLNTSLNRSDLELDTPVIAAAPPALTGSIEALVHEHANLIRRMRMCVKGAFNEGQELRVKLNGGRKKISDNGVVIVEGFLLFNEPKNIAPTNTKAELESYFDNGAKLYLTLPKETLKSRRFSRSIYTDHPEGGRMPGQMWKSEGYFDEVVSRSNEWLESNIATNGKLPSDIGILDGDGKTMEEIVSWAVDYILRAWLRKLVA